MAIPAARAHCNRPEAVDLVEMLRDPPSGEKASLHFEKLAVEWESSG